MATKTTQPIDTSTDISPKLAHEIAHMRAPYIDGGHATSFPTPIFLTCLDDPELQDLGVAACLQLSIRDAAAVDPWEWFLCEALARHWSYYKAFEQKYEDNRDKPTLEDSYVLFKRDFIVALKTARGAVGLRGYFTKRCELIKLDYVLTRHTFSAIPALFRMCFKANDELIVRLILDTEDRKVMDSDRPKALLREASTRLADEWISLEGVMDVLAYGSALAKEGSSLARRRLSLAKRWLMLARRLGAARRFNGLGLPVNPGTVDERRLPEAVTRFNGLGLPVNPGPVDERGLRDAELTNGAPIHFNNVNGDRRNEKPAAVSLMTPEEWSALSAYLRNGPR